MKAHRRYHLPVTNTPQCLPAELPMAPSKWSPMTFSLEAIPAATDVGDIGDHGRMYVAATVDGPLHLWPETGQ